eukprot:GHUV01011675.1.p1 GENE.GHUV01011675.1~~GHUV01011675.1.p1  ORF type:complete len:291 (+),score=58.77 GHUV01011675.1:365-1237(+)
MQRLGGLLLTTAKAIVACHCQRVAPTITTIFEIIALAAPLIKTSADAHPAVASSEEEATHSAPHSSSSSQHHRLPHVPGTAAVGVPAAPVRFLLLLSLRLARGWAPAVVVAQGVRLVGNVVQQRENKDNKVGREGTEVRALQLGLSVVPRVDPRASRSLADYCQIYREWLLLLRGRLAQSGVESPEGLFDEGEEGDEELMRFALCYNILQVCQETGITQEQEGMSVLVSKATRLYLVRWAGFSAYGCDSSCYGYCKLHSCLASSCNSCRCRGRCGASCCMNVVACQVEPT